MSRYLPLLNAFGWLRFSESQNFRGAYPMALIALNKDPVTVTAYQVGGFELATRLSDPPGNFYSALIDSKTTGAAQDNAILRRLAHEAIGDQKVDTATLAARLCGWLRDRHTYSLSPRIPAGPGDPLVRWTNSNERGHCELFAGAFVLLARAAGYPARMVTGFRGGTWNGFISSSFMVRNSDAHAWAEIYDPVTTSWLRADPLEIPAATQAAAAGEVNLGRMDRSWSARLDSLRVFWYRRVVNFDEQAQVHTFQVVKEATQATVHRLRERLLDIVTRVGAWFRTPWDAGRIASVITLTGAAAVLTWAWRWLRLAVLQHLFFWRRLARRGDPIRREAGRWLRRVVDTDSPERERIIPDLQRLRFGARETWPEAAVVFRRARRVLRSRSNRWRRPDEPSSH